jgi:hypothetical protein
VAADPHTESLLLVTLEAKPASEAASGENPWLGPLRVAVRSDPRFELCDDRRLPSGYRCEHFAIRH